MEGLSSLIHHACEKGIWKLIRIRNNGYEISHLGFTNDILLFSKATKSGLARIKKNYQRFLPLVEKTPFEAVIFDISMWILGITS